MDKLEPLGWVPAFSLDSVRLVQIKSDLVCGIPLHFCKVLYCERLPSDEHIVGVDVQGAATRYAKTMTVMWSGANSTGQRASTSFHSSICALDQVSLSLSLSLSRSVIYAYVAMICMKDFALRHRPLLCHHGYPKHVI